ncbi:hypothetical protein ACGFMK_23820 [Amycolatopsis sp. NPDC049252]|uniref:hypothetical protein n=1 Tax=Amycolatopsis sp. NPDC049252 TaxID=3363933 RepID=UPI003715C9C7
MRRSSWFEKLATWRLRQEPGSALLAMKGEFVSRKAMMASGLLAAAMVLTGTGVAAASTQATNPNTCKFTSDCGTGTDPVPGGRRQIWCDWNGGPASYFRVLQNGLWTQWSANGANSGTVGCGTTGDLAGNLHVQVHLSQPATSISVGWHL